jgi:hypothetical protein
MFDKCFEYLSSLDSFQTISHVSILYYQDVCVIKNLTTFHFQINVGPKKVKHKPLVTLKVVCVNLFAHASNHLQDMSSLHLML